MSSEHDTAGKSFLGEEIVRLTEILATEWLHGEQALRKPPSETLTIADNYAIYRVDNILLDLSNKWHNLKLAHRQRANSL